MARRRKTEWKLPQGSLQICFEILQICDSEGNAPIELTEHEVDEWLRAMTEARAALKAKGKVS